VWPNCSIPHGRPRLAAVVERATAGAGLQAGVRRAGPLRDPGQLQQLQGDARDRFAVDVEADDAVLPRPVRLVLRVDRGDVQLVDRARRGDAGVLEGTMVSLNAGSAPFLTACPNVMVSVVSLTANAASWQSVSRRSDKSPIYTRATSRRPSE
jgi:hypothetical protein